MKQVNPKLYDQKYFNFQSLSPNFDRKLKVSDFQNKYKQTSNLIKLKKTDIICDYGCGTGDLSFLLSLKYNCQIIAIDYSSDAIKICQEKFKLFKKNTNKKVKIKFINHNNKNLPKLKNIKVVFFCDVFEHLYDSEIKLITSQVTKWGSNIYLAIHTDNNNYLKFVQPIINKISLLLKTTTKKEIEKNKVFDKKRHINLNTPKQLKKKLIKLKFSEIKREYPKVSRKVIKSQLAKLSKFKIFNELSFFIIKKIPLISPSFFALYRSNSDSRSEANLKSGN